MFKRLCDVCKREVTGKPWLTVFVEQRLSSPKRRHLRRRPSDETVIDLCLGCARKPISILALRTAARRRPS